MITMDSTTVPPVNNDTKTTRPLHWASDLPSQVFYQLCLYRLYPCPECYPQPSQNSIERAIEHALTHGLDPASYVPGQPDRLCPRHQLTFFHSRAMSGLPTGPNPLPDHLLRHDFALPPLINSYHDTAKDCPACRPTTEEALFAAAKNAVTGRRLFAPYWVKFCPPCKAAFRQSEKEFISMHRRHFQLAAGDEEGDPRNPRLFMVWWMRTLESVGRTKRERELERRWREREERVKEMEGMMAVLVVVVVAFLLSGVCWAVM
ncbi:hypothetical protein GE09DRAFT_199739 [Coniochaeta sp. 2T2.1]|nr:hypothetical protein GE09DRAFT_199739 [Coniochaeta sp. 2T2.1]